MVASNELIKKDFNIDRDRITFEEQKKKKKKINELVEENSSEVKNLEQVKAGHTSANLLNEM